MIELENHSPFPHFLYEKTGYRGKPFDVLAIKGTFRLKTDLSIADVDEDQSPPVMADVYWGEPETSSLKFETDLIIAKQRTDIHVIGHAYAEQGTPDRRWLAGIRIGELRKPLHVTGTRVWHYASDRWQLGEPEPVASVPLRYELAYGGQCHEDQTENAEPVVYRPNPIGLGFLDLDHLATERHYPAPQIESADPACAIADIRQRYPPEGFGPLSRWWEPRIKYAGTYDAAWQKDHWPFLPDDFDFAFYQSAPAGLQAEGFLQGDEPVVLVGLLPEAKSVATALSGYRPVCVVEDDGNTLHTLFPRLSTVTFDTDERLIHQTWHLTLPRDFAARHIVLGTLVPPPEHCGDLRRKFAHDTAHG
ncbi:MAG: DUF2169 domain-containing protein [Proteobacteria bacterium]|nr:DUF2169 domain-containing protein [Pseudomonadota bacterium]